MEKLREFFNQLDATGREQFCVQVGISEGFLRKKISTKSLFKPEICSKIELVSNKEVTRQDLRPDWREIWIELAEKEAAENSGSLNPD